MAEITEDQIRLAYTLGKQVYENSTDKQTAVDQLVSRGMNAASAADYINGLQRLLSGESYQRTLSSLGTRIFLENIKNDFAPEKLWNAISALSQHIEYYESVSGSRQNKLRELLGAFDTRRSWIFQGNPSKNDINQYIAKAGIVYWSVKQENYQQEMKVGDNAVIWRGKGDSDGPYGVIAMGTVVESPTEIDQVKHPEFLIEHIAGKEDLGYRIRAGIKLKEIRLTKEEGMIDSERFDQDPELAATQLRTARQGSTFSISGKQFSSILKMWNNKISDSKEKKNNMHTAESLNRYFNEIDTKYHAQANRGRFLEFWSDYSRSSSRFLIGFQQLADGLKTLLASGRDLAEFQTNHEKTWRDMSQIQAATPVFQSFLTVQTSALFHLISQIVHWANSEPASAYNDKEMKLTPDRLARTIAALTFLHNEGHGEQSAPKKASGTYAGKNLIVYGAPGSGKSYFIDYLVSENDIRTVFHPEYQNSDFVGGVRPSMKNDNVTYAYSPGPFIQALLKAVREPENVIHLVIEEINRANAAAVFGDVFQLLDRKEDGSSQYSISTDMALRNYLESEGYPNPERIQLPANLAILATMNSSDQGVFLLDAAFKRRWEFHYCPIDFNKAYASETHFTDLIVPYAGENYSWKTFAQAINGCLKLHGIEEDRLIGPFFLSTKERENADICKKSISGKLLIYLWDDVLRHGLRQEVFRKDTNTFSALVDAYNKGEEILASPFPSELEKFS